MTPQHAPEQGQAGAGTRTWHAELAWLPGVGVLPDVLIEASGDRFTRITQRQPAAGLPGGTIRLAGLTMPALANAHSHAFHRALRGTAQAGGGTFWTWRERMYQVAAKLDPDSYLALARAVYAEMALAGVGCVGEFHYLHHAPGGTGYADPNAMSRAVVRAAAEAGIRITLLDTCYLSGGLDAGGAGRAAASVRRRDRAGVGGTGRLARRGLARHARAGRQGRRRDPLRARRAARPDAHGRGVDPLVGGSAARAPVRAGRRERCLPGRLRGHAHGGSVRGRSTRPPHQRRARHPPDQCRHRAAWRQ